MSRRTLLRGAGGIVVGLPFLNAMEARGATVTNPKRFGAMMMMASPVAEKWWPTGTTETSFTLPDALSPLNAALGSGALLRSKVNILRGIGYHAADLNTGIGDGHHRVISGMLTAQQQNAGPFYLNAGWANGPSIDQVLATKVGTPPYKSLTLAAGLTYSADTTRTSFKAAEQPVDPINNPGQVWDMLFKDLSTDTGPTSAELALAALRARRKSVLDVVRDQYKSLSPKLGKEDQARLQGHFESVRDLELRVTAAPPPETAACVKPDRPANFTQYPDSNYAVLLKAHLDMIAYAYRCDLTRIATLQTAGSVSDMSYPFAPLGITLKQHGEINHTPANYHFLEPTSKWYAQMFANFLVQLDSWKEAGGTSVLDNTLFWYTYEHENAGQHSHSSIPMILAGGGAGQVRTGRYIQYNNKPHNDLFAAICNFMGAPTSSFGDARVATGILPGLS